MHTCDYNVGSGEFGMCHGNVGLLKINTLTLRNPICTVL